MKTGTENIDKIKRQAALSSLYTAIFITVIKILAAYFSGSLGVLSEVFSSSVDILVCGITLFSISYAAKPPDEEHHYGHEKIENFSSLIQVIVLFITCSYILFEAFQRIFLNKPVELNISIWTYGVLILSIILDIHRSRNLSRIAAQTNSQALEADALHFSSDILSSAVVIIGLLCVQFNISDNADAFAALIVACIIIVMGAKMFKKSFDSLMDKVPLGLTEKIRNEVLKVEGVESIKSQRIRSSGSKIFIDMTVNISRVLPFSHAHDITDNVERKIMEISPNSDIVIHSEPIETDKETLNEKIKHIVSSFGLKSHDIFSHRIGKEVHTELHVEVKGTNDLVKAHSIIDEIESKIKEILPVISEVKIHLDEPSGIIFDTTDITDTSKEITNTVNNILQNSADVISCSNLKVMNTNNRIRVSLDCRFKTDKTFDEVHDIVTVLESRIYLELKNKFPDISNVIIHAEPDTLN